MFEKLKILLINKNKKGLAIILFFILSTMVLETLGIGILYPLIQFFVEGKTNVAILNKFNFLTQNISEELFLWYGLFVILLFYFLKLLFVLKSIDFQNKFIFRVSANISNLLYEKIISDDFENSISTEVSNIVKKFQNDINHLKCINPYGRKYCYYSYSYIPYLYRAVWDNYIINTYFFVWSFFSKNNKF